MFEALAERRGLRIVETGCIRTPGNWAGDGQSSVMFDDYANEYDGYFHTIDLSPESIAAAKSVCKGKKTYFHTGDSIERLWGMTHSIDLLYLDSFDLNPFYPMPSAVHHLMELTAAARRLQQFSIVAVDDFESTAAGGKGMLVDQFMKHINAHVIYEGYQKVWMVP